MKTETKTQKRNPKTVRVVREVDRGEVFECDSVQSGVFLNWTHRWTAYIAPREYNGRVDSLLIKLLLHAELSQQVSTDATR